MGKAEITIFIVLVNIVLLIFIAGIIIFVFQFRQRKMEYVREKKIVDEQHQRELLNTQLEIQHQTMQHIGSEIHDSVGQKLTLAFLYTNQLTYNNQFPGLSERINTIGNIINESLEELRALSKTLSNPSLAQAGLLDLLKHESVRVNASGVCRIFLKSNAETLDLPPSEKNIIFRILQEFIQNSLKHAQCKRIDLDLNLQVQENKLYIMATDDGKGFDITDEPRGIGLSNMKRRARQIGMGLHLQSKPGKGTILMLDLAIQKKTLS